MFSGRRPARLVLALTLIASVAAAQACTGASEEVPTPAASSAVASAEPWRTGASPPRTVGDQRDIVYKTVDGAPIALDIHAADGAGPHPVIIWIHGGGWQSGDKAQCLPVRLGFADRGYTVACVNYRLSGVAIFPAQIEDVRDAIAFLRGHADEYGLDPDRFVAWGSSAGGHLAALVGTTSGESVFTGDARASAVQAVVDFYGPIDLTAMVTTPGYTRHAQPDSAESLLLGGPVLENPEAAQRASPLTYIDGDEPPFLIVHGTADPVVPLAQSQLLYDALTASGVTADLTILDGAGHGGPAFSAPDTVDLVVTFLDQHL
jgi:acetyl esterase/lipase